MDTKTYIKHNFPEILDDIGAGVKKYRVLIKRTQLWDFDEIAAQSEEEAKDIALQDSLGCNPDDDYLEDATAWEIVVLA